MAISVTGLYGGAACSFYGFKERQLAAPWHKSSLSDNAILMATRAENVDECTVFTLRQISRKHQSLAPLPWAHTQLCRKEYSVGGELAYRGQACAATRLG